MAKKQFKSVDQYLAAQPDEARAVLEQVRRVIQRALPKADEAISYQIPAYKIGGKAVIYFAGWKQHFSLYPATAGVVRKFKHELAEYEVRKGTIRFPLAEKVPVRLIQGIVQVRAQEAKDEE
jgi:uncharacterized protein YdhG (YjbR/CyaY superfamily)